MNKYSFATSPHQVIITIYYNSYICFVYNAKQEIYSSFYNASVIYSIFDKIITPLGVVIGPFSK